MNFINQIYKKLLEKPKFILFLLVLVFSFSVYNAKNFQLDASADSLLLENDPDLNYLRSVNERYSSEDFFVITYSPKKKINDEAVQELKKFVNEIDNIQWVSKTISILNAPLFESSDQPLIEKINNIQYITTPGIEINRALNELKNSARPGVVEVRGEGLMIGIEFDYNTAALRKKLLMENHIFTGSSSDPNTIRLLPSLSVGENEIDQLLNGFKSVLYSAPQSVPV